MTRTVLLIGAAVAVGALLISTGAVPLADTTDEISRTNVVMQPADGPNGKYAQMNAAGELELVLTGENPAMEGEGIPGGARSPLDRVFTVTYTGEQYARVWFTDGAEAVRFYRDEDPADSLEGADNAVRLGPNETMTVGVLVDTRGEHDVESVSEFTVHVEQGTPTGTPSPPQTTEPPQTPPTPSETPESTTASPTTPLTPRSTATETPVTSTTASPTTTASISVSPSTPSTPTETPDSNRPGGGGDTLTTLPGSGVGGLTSERTTATATESEQQAAPAGGVPTEIGGFQPTSLLLTLLVLALLLLGLAWYRRRSDR